MAQQKNAPENSKSSSSKKSQPPYILIVEDEPAHSTLIRHALRASNPNVVVKVADSLKEYRSAIAASLPEIVLMDVNLPDGKALEALTASPDAGLFPIVVMTSYGNEKLAVKAMKAGAIDYIVKSPETYTAIAQTVERALREWKLLQERKQAEEALAESELRFRSLYENVTIGLYRTTPAGKIILANQALVKMLGYQSFEKLAERNLVKAGFEKSDERIKFLKRIEAKGEINDLESSWVRQDGSVLFVRESARAIRDAHGKTLYYDGAVEDITEQKIAEAAGREAEGALRRVSRLYATLSKVNHTIVRVKDREKLFEAICRIAVEFGQFRMAWIGLADEQSGQVKPLTHYGYEAGYLQTVTINISKDSPFGKGPSGIALREGRIVINDNSQVDPKMSPWRNEALKRGYLSSAAVPFHFKGQVIGLLNLYATESEFFTDEEQHLLAEIGDNISFALDSIAVESERKQAEEALTSSESRFRKVYSEGLVPMAFLNQNFQFTQVNEPFEKMLGYTEAELKRMTFREVTHPENIQQDLEHVQKLLRGELEVYTTEKRYIAKDKEIRWGFVNVGVLKDAIGAFLSFVVMIVDVTERKRMEESLRASGVRLHLALESANSGAWEWDLLTNENIWSDELWKLYGLEPHSCIPTYENWRQTIHPDDREIAEKKVQEAARTESELNSEWRVVDRDGTVRWLLSRGRPLRDANGKAIRFVGIVSDITERKQAEETIIQHAIEHTKMLSTITEGYCQVDDQGRILDVNAAYCLMSGYSKEELLQLQLHNIEAVESMDETARRMHAIMEAGTSFFESKHRKKDGKLFDVEINIALWQEQKRFFVFIQDITERKRAEEALQQSEERLSSFMNSASDSFYLLDANLNFIEINKRGLEIIGKTREEVVGRNMADIVPDLKKSGRYEKHLEVLRTGIPFVVENFIPHPVFGDMHFILKSFRAGDCLGVIASDITERKQAEELLKQSETKYRLLADHMKDTIWLMDMNLRTTYISPSVEKLRGYTLEELQQLPLDRQFTPASYKFAIDAFSEEMSKVMSDPTYFILRTLDLEFYRKDGTTYWSENRFSLIRDENGSPVSIMGEGRDITDRKQAEEALREIEARYRLISQNTADVIWTMDIKTGKFTYVSDSVQKLRGYTPDEVLNQTLAEVLTPESLQEVTSLLQHTVQKRKQGDTSQQKTISLVDQPCKDGSVVTTEVVSSIVYNEQSEPIEIIGVSRDITERKHAEEAIRESEKRFSVLSNATFEGIVLSEAGRVIDVNEQLATMFGYERLEMIGLMIEKFVAPESLELVKQHIRSGSEEPYEHLSLRKNGTVFHVEIRAKSLPYKGRIVRVTAIRDITERKLVQEALEKNEKKLNELFETAPVGYHEIDEQGNITAVNKTELTMLGYSYAQMLGWPAWEFVTDTEGSKKRVLEKLAGNLPANKNSEQVFTRKDGSTFSALVDDVILRDQLGKIVGIRTTILDITKRKQAEEEVRKLSRAVEQSGSSIVITDTIGNIEYVNPKFVEVTGYSFQEALGKNPRILKSEQTSSEEYKNLWNAITNGQVWQGEFHNKKKNGESFWESATISPVKDANGTITHFIAVKEDITQQKAMANQLRQMQKLEGLGTLAGGIAHDFNNILGIILAYITSIKRFKDDTKKIDLAIDTITKSVDRGKTLVQQILTFARKTETAFGAVNVNEVVAEIMTMVMGTFPKVLTYAQNLDKSITFIKADRSQIYQSLLNLTVNARDAMPSGGVLTIATRMLSGINLRAKYPDAVESGYICIEVSDTGEGMSEEIRNRIFEPFFTTKEQGKGTGLGLAVVFGVVQSHKGFIEVESELGKGTTFRLYLPALQAAEPLSEIHEDAMEEIKGGTETLLVVEDEELLMMSLRMVLAEKGYNVISAGDGLEAVNMYKEREKEIALVLTDLGLPKLTGMEECAQIKKLNPKARMIVATGFLDPEMKSELLKLSIQHFLYKPYDLMKVLKIVREVLDGK